MCVDFEGPQLFAAGPFGDDGRGHLRLILVDRVEAWLDANPLAAIEEDAARLVERMIERCALEPLALGETQAVAWSISSTTGRDGEPRLRIEKVLPFTGNELLFDLGPRAALPPAPRGALTATGLRVVATAPWDNFDLIRDAIDAAETRVRQFLNWQHLDVADINRELGEIAAERLTAWRARRRHDHMLAATVVQRGFAEVRH